MSAPIVRKRSTICVEKFVIHPKRVAPHAAVAATNAASKAIENTPDPDAWNLSNDDIVLGCTTSDKESAIRACGRMLVDRGCVDEGYIDAMVERDREVSVFIGNGVAIPHGTNEAKRFVKKTGVVVLQYPDGVDFDGEKAYVLFGIAGKGDEHLEILSQIALLFSDDDEVAKLKAAQTPEELLSLLATVNES